MLRVVPAEVLALRPSTQDVIPFLRTASVLVETYLTPLGLSDELLAQIELWWTAHLMAIGAQGTTGGQMARKQFSDTSISYSTSKLGEGFAASPFGQQLLLLYPPLATVLTQKRASILVD